MGKQKPIEVGQDNSLEPDTGKDHHKTQPDQWEGLFNFNKTERLTNYINRTLPPEGRKFYNEHLSEVENLIRYTSQFEMDNSQLSLEVIRLGKENDRLREQCENLSVYAAMIQYYFNTRKGINFLKKINIHQWLLKNYEFYNKIIKAMNYV
jgi:hypothetical protein